jgi:hypothetical protein
MGLLLTGVSAINPFPSQTKFTEVVLRDCQRGLRGFAKNFDGAPCPAHPSSRLARVRVRIDMREILDDLLERSWATSL